MSTERLRTTEVEALLTAFGTLADNDERYAFLVDVATIREIQDMAQRLAVARLLGAGAHYTSIQEATGAKIVMHADDVASSTTISRVSRSLNYGEGGYRTVIDRLGPAAEGGDA